MLHCEDCGARPSTVLVSRREECVDPPDEVQTWACDAHRLDVSERMLNEHGNVCLSEDLG